MAEAAAELARVFAALEPAVAEAEEVRRSARAVADERRRSASEEAERIVTDARGRLDVLRAEAASAQERVEAELTSTPCGACGPSAIAGCRALEADMHLLELGVDDAEREETRRLRWAGADGGRG